MKFEKRMAVVNKYGDYVVDLEKDGDFWKVPDDRMEAFCTMLDEGDELKVVAYEAEVE